MPDKLTVSGKEYRVIRLLGKGKGGYSYLVTDGRQQYVLKQIHHEPCSYYTFGDKMEAELRDHDRLLKAGIRIPRLLDNDIREERILKEYIEGPLISELAAGNAVGEAYFRQVREMSALAYDAGLNIDWFPTNFVVHDGTLYYIDYECNPYSDAWNFENWGIKYWSKTLVTERLLLRRFFPCDLDDLYAWFSDPEAAAYEPYRPMTPGETEEELKRRSESGEFIAAEDKETHRVIGNVYLGRRDPDTCEIRCGFGRQWRHKGYAREACAEVIRDAFANGTRRICAECDPEDTAMLRLLGSLGMKKEADTERDVCFRKGERAGTARKNIYIYSLQDGAGLTAADKEIK